MNLVVVQGVVRDDPVARSLSSGQQIVSFELSVPSGGNGIEMVPIVVFDMATAVATNDEVVVIGRVRKRFFRVGTVTQSRTEVVASSVVPSRRRARVSKAIDQVVVALTTG